MLGHIFRLPRFLPGGGGGKLGLLRLLLGLDGDAAGAERRAVAQVHILQVARQVRLAAEDPVALCAGVRLEALVLGCVVALAVLGPEDDRAARIYATNVGGRVLVLGEDVCAPVGGCAEYARARSLCAGEA